MSADSGSTDAGAEGKRAGKKCPLCKEPATAEFTPFCSRGCRDRDLISWFGEGYKIPSRSTEEDELQKSSDYGVDSTHS